LFLEPPLEKTVTAPRLTTEEVGRRAHWPGPGDPAASGRRARR